MRIDLHNHTTRCNHAEGTIDEYIQKAIELGIDIYGFSEHAPMDFDPEYRLAKTVFLTFSYSHYFKHGYNDASSFGGSGKKYTISNSNVPTTINDIIRSMVPGLVSSTKNNFSTTIMSNPKPANHSRRLI